MRSWHPIPPSDLDRQRLLGEHVELHVLFNSVVRNRDGWRHHPERKRWENHLPALVERHNQIVQEMLRRGYNHRSPMNLYTNREIVWPGTWQPIEEMRRILDEKQRKS